MAAPNEALRWTRGTPAVFRSSAHVERGFCAACGTPLFYRDVNGPRVNLTLGSLDHPEQFPPLGQCGIEGRMPWFGALAGITENGATEAGSQAAWAEAIRRSNRQHPDHDTDQWPAESPEE